METGSKFTNEKPNTTPSMSVFTILMFQKLATICKQQDEE